MEERIEVGTIMEMSVDAILLLNGLVDVAREAKEAAELIHEAYKNGFGIGEDKIEVWCDRDGYNHEYLTHAGVWQARYLHQTYDVECTADAIFEHYRAEYLINHNFTREYTDGCCQSKAGEQKLIASYFRSFVSRIKQQGAAKLDGEGIF